MCLVSFLPTLWQHHLLEWPESCILSLSNTYIIFITKKLDATAKNRYQILILKTIKHVFKGEKCTFTEFLIQAEQL